MGTLIEELLDSLRQVARHYESLLPVMHREQEAARLWDIDAMQRATSRKEAILADIEEQERKRATLLKKLGAELTVPAHGMKLSALSAEMPEPWRTRLSEAAENLRKLVGMVRRVNEEGRLTVSHCLQLIRNTMSFWEHVNGTSHGYGASGRLCSCDRGRLLSGMF